MSNQPEIDFEQAERFLSIIAPDNNLTFQTLPEGKAKGKKDLNRIFNGTFDEHKEILKALNLAGAGAFFMVNEGDLQGRKAVSVRRIRAVFIDIDENGEETYQKLVNLERYMPAFIISTSPGRYQAYWFLDRDLPLEHFSAFQKLFATRLGGDPAVTDLPRLMRVPGFLHNKGGPFQVQIVFHNERAQPLPVEQILKKLTGKVELSAASLPAIQNNWQDYQVCQSQGLLPWLPEALGHINSEPYATWLNIGMALHYESGGSDEGLLLWVKWSSTAPNFDEADCRSKWKSFGKNDGANLTAGTIYHLATEAGWSGYEAVNDQPPSAITDIRIAQFFSVNSKHVRYWSESKKWLIFDGKRWSSDSPGGAYPLLKDMIEVLYEHARKITDDNKRQEVLKNIIKLESHRRQEALLDAAAVVPEMIVNSHQLDRDPMLLNVRNGTLILRTGKLQPHSPDDYLTRLVDIDYDPSSICPEFDRFLDRILGGKQALIGYLQRFIGYCLTGMTTEQVLLFLYGTGANGKSTLATIIEKLLCDLASVADSSLLMQRDNRNASNDLAALRGARLVKVSEFNDGERLAEATIKTLTGGDRITCRFLYGEFFDYTPQFKILLLGNYKPLVRGRDHGIWRRIHLLPFNVTIPENERDRHLMDKLTAELPGILAWAVAGCLEWQRIGLSPPAEVLNEVDSYRKGEDIFGQWLEERCQRGEQHSTSASILLDSFKDFSGWRNLTPTKFGRMLADSGYIKEKSGVSSWRGVALTSTTHGQLG